jgi:hypothetical protein
MTPEERVIEARKSETINLEDLDDEALEFLERAAIDLLEQIERKPN